jgi:hypothetical protein
MKYLIVCTEDQLGMRSMTVSCITFSFEKLPVLLSRLETPGKSSTSLMLSFGRGILRIQVAAKKKMVISSQMLCVPFEKQRRLDVVCL